MRDMPALGHHHSLLFILELNKADRAFGDSHSEERKFQLDLALLRRSVGIDEDRAREKSCEG